MLTPLTLSGRATSPRALPSRGTSALRPTTSRPAASLRSSRQQTSHRHSFCGRSVADLLPHVHVSNTLPVNGHRTAPRRRLRCALLDLTILTLTSCSGTEKQHVADDYALRLAAGVAECKLVVDEALSTLISGQPNGLAFSDCPFLNQSICDATTSGVNTAIVLYSAIGQNRTEYVSVPVPNVRGYRWMMRQWLD